jgi:hypothetical protein
MDVSVSRKMEIPAAQRKLIRLDQIVNDAQAYAGSVDDHCDVLIIPRRACGAGAQPGAGTTH